MSYFFRGYDPAGAPLDGPDPHLAANQRLADAILEKLEEHYPGHPWFVEANAGQGIARLRLGGFTNWSWIIHLAYLWGDPGMRIVVKAGGEFLERYRMPRSGIDYAAYRASLARYGQPWQWNKRPPE